MTTTFKTSTTVRAAWLAMGLALVAGCYFLGGLLILLRRRGLLIFGLAMNTLVLLFFFQMYQARPAVIFSPGGLMTKAAQLLLEVSLLYVIIADWRRARR